MQVTSSLSSKIIQDKILENYAEFQYIFIEFQSRFLSSLYRRYQSLENGHLVLYFARRAHEAILRQKDYDLNFDLSFKNFWQNHSEITIKRTSIIRVAEDTTLPKETARRKILELVKQRILIKKNKNISWLPNDQYKKAYNIVIDNEIAQISKLIRFVCEKINLSNSIEEITKEIKERFSFYWFHFLGVELEYLNLWNKKLKDLELLVIALQCTNMLASKAKEIGMSFEKLYAHPHLVKDFKNISLSATSISEVTGIPRVTCIRKLEQLVKLNAIQQDNISKRYHIVSELFAKNLASKQTSEKVIEIFSQYFFICIRALMAKTLK